MDSFPHGAIPSWSCSFLHSIHGTTASTKTLYSGSSPFSCSSTSNILLIGFTRRELALRGSSNFQYQRQQEQQNLHLSSINYELLWRTTASISSSRTRYDTNDFDPKVEPSFLGDVAVDEICQGWSFPLSERGCICRRIHLASMSIDSSSIRDTSRKRSQAECLSHASSLYTPRKKTSTRYVHLGVKLSYLVANLGNIPLFHAHSGNSSPLFDSKLGHTPFFFWHI